MNSKDYIKALQTNNYNYIVENALKTQAIITTFAEKIDNFHKLFSDVLDIDQDSITLRTEDREKGIEFIKSFGGQWTKEPYWADKKSVEYKQEFLHPTPTFTGQIAYFKCICPPSAACRIIEEEVLVPEHKEKRFKIECGKEQEGFIDSPEVQQEGPQNAN